jgi:hypothetical protein
MSTSGRRKEAGSLLSNHQDYVSAQDFGNPQHLFMVNIQPNSMFAVGNHVKSTQSNKPHGGIRGGSQPVEALGEYCSADAAYSAAQC